MGIYKKAIPKHKTDNKNVERFFGISVIDLSRLGMLIKHHGNDQKN